ncbi:four-domain proteases inhibitor [Exaiptasia diaphana]|uniref:Uncharacterized protein n=1 Tax=Exaiptasia diaphana TaxID=2652724 RepID=A0A913YN61_EXADI|nr:four-domain proteases inhibitor [Exaiptasia diaphana]
MKTSYLLIIVCALFASVLSLSCYCEKKKCSTTFCPNGGTVKDECGCCDVCAKQVGQKCGGLYDLAGRCDKGLSCVVRKHGIVINVKTLMKPGRCEPAACSSLSCPKYYSCGVVNNQAVCECPRHCKKSGRKVCDINTGREYDSECELRKYECKRNIQIPFKHGPCKRCIKDGQLYKFGEQVRNGPCEICSCVHGIWNCKNTFCLDQNTKNHGVPHFAIKKSKNKKKCTELQCRRCKYGHIVDDNGCKTCHCKPKRKNICRLSKNPGRPCGSVRTQTRRFFFNYKKGKCEPFIFFGCHHNSNNFKTKKACEARCLI